MPILSGLPRPLHTALKRGLSNPQQQFGLLKPHLIVSGRTLSAPAALISWAASDTRARTTLLRLQHPTGCEINVFGVEHLAPIADGAEFILRERPSLVVVETALDIGHGSATGNTLSRNSQSSDYFVSIFQQLGQQLSLEEQPVSSELWQNLKPRWAGEQLAYIAAFAVAADIVFGDEVKHNTFRRLASAASLVDLDMAFGAQSWLNYQEMLEGKCSQPWDPAEMGLVEHIMLTEREAMLCKSLDQAARTGRQGIVGIFGESHLPGVQRLWQEGSWQTLAAPAADDDASPSASSSGAASTIFDDDTASEGSSLSFRPASELHPGLRPLEIVGVQRALLESVIRLKSVPSVVNDLRRALGDVPSEAWEPYCWAHELYASPRMLLACLSREQLQRVCSGLHCDMWQVLQPLRRVRPVNGGSGLDIDLTFELRSLNFDM